MCATNKLAHNLAGSQGLPGKAVTMATSQPSIVLALAFLWNSRPMTDQPTRKSGSEKARLRAFHARHASSSVSAVRSRCPAQTLVTAAYLSPARGLGPAFIFRERSNWDAPKEPREAVRQRSGRAQEGKVLGGGGGGCGWCSRRTTECQSIAGWQGSRESLPRSSAGANMCSRYNLHCNQKLTGERPGWEPAASSTETRGGEASQTSESCSTRGEGRAFY